MAEFSEVMKQLARMTNACNGKCDECPLDNSAICIGPWCAGNTEGIAEAERIVMQWAAEHPEPVYPSWGDYLCEIGLINVYMSKKEVIDRLFFNTIPPDTVEKLGWQPKEVKE